MKAEDKAKAEKEKRDEAEAKAKAERERGDEAEKKLVPLEEQAKKRAQPDYWDKETAKSRWGRFMLASKQYFKAAGSAVLEGAKIVGKWGLEGLKILWNNGFRLWDWITSNPKTAYFTLVMLKNFKTQLCRGSASWFIAARVDLNDPESVRAYIQKLDPTRKIKPNTSLGDLRILLKDVSKPFLNDIIGKGSQVICKEAGKKFAPLFGAAMGGACVALLPGVGVMIGASVATVSTSIFEICCDQVGQMSEQAVYQQNVENCFSMLKEIVDPVACIEEMGKESVAIIDRATQKGGSHKGKKEKKRTRCWPRVRGG